MEKFKYEIEIERFIPKAERLLQASYKGKVIELKKENKSFFIKIGEIVIEIIEKNLSAYAQKKFYQLYDFDFSKGIFLKKGIVNPLARTSFPNPFAVSNKELPGVYLILQANLNYETDELMYTCKIGRSGNLAKRIKQYHTYNTGFYHNDMSIIIPDDKKREEFENAAQNGLIKMGYNQTCGESNEWFLIDKEMFYDMKKNGVEIMKKLAAM